MLEVGKTYRNEKDKEDVYILAALPKEKQYFNYEAYFVNRDTKDTEPGELGIHEDIITEYNEVKE